MELTPASQSGRTPLFYACLVGNLPAARVRPPTADYGQPVATSAAVLLVAPELTAPLCLPQALAEAGANVDFVCPRNGVAIVHGASTRRRNCRLGSLLASTG